MFTTHDLKRLKEDLLTKEHTYRALAKKYGVHEVTIRRYNVQFGLGRKPIDFKGLEEDLKTGPFTKEYLAEKYSICPKTVYNVKKRLGLVTPK